MTTETPNPEQVTETTTAAPDLGTLSFSDYEKARRGEALPAKEATKPAPEAKASEQKESVTSGTTETEEVESEQTEHEAAGDESEKSDTAADKEQGQDKPGKKKSGFQKRIDKLNAAKADAQREAEYWKREALKGATEPKKDPVEPKAVPAEGEPEPDQFETHAAYVKAVAKWETKQALIEHDKEASKKSLESEHKSKVQVYLDKRAAFAEKNPDFEEVISDVDDIPVSPTVSQLIVEAEDGPAIAYELAKNREEYARICKLSPLAAAKEIGKLEDKIAARSSEAKDPQKLTTNAPKPLTPVGTGKGTQVSKSPEEMSYSEYEKYRRDQMKRKRA